MNPDEELNAEEVQQFLEEMRLEEQRQLSAEILRNQREQEQWQANKSTPLLPNSNYRDVRPVYNRRLQRGRNGSHIH